MPRASVVALISLVSLPAGRVMAAEPVVRGPGDLAHEPGAPRGMKPVGDWMGPLSQPLPAIPAPIGQAYCQINVEGVNRATETDYLPRVITCENGGANFEALKAQAIAARSVAYYNMANEGQICDSQGCQVYTCNAEPKQIHHDAVKATAGQYLSYNGWITYAFYVAGDPQQPASCVDTDNANVAGTEQFVTFNAGKTLYDVTQTKLGFVFPEDLKVQGYGQNRGCMSQWGARCLENTKGQDSTAILKFYYGADIQILQAQGPCVEEPPPPNKPAEGNFEAVDCATGLSAWAWDPDHPDTPIHTYVSFLAPFGDPAAVAFTVLADAYREDLCAALGACEHGLVQRLPRSLMDGVARPIHLYGVDVDEGGHTEIAGSPQQFACPPPPLPAGVRRHVPDPATLDAWSFSTFWQAARVDAATLAGIDEWQPIGAAPKLVQVQGDPQVWLVDAGFRRHVPGPEVAAAWQFDLASAQTVTQDELQAMPEGTPVRPEPFLIQGEGPEVYVLDDVQCPPGGDPKDPLCPPIEGTTDGEGTTGASDGGSSGAPTTGEAPTDPTQGEDSGGPPSGTSRPVLPPGFGEWQGDGCTCAADGGLAQGAGLWGLVALAAVRRRRRRTDPALREGRDPAAPPNAAGAPGLARARETRYSPGET